MIYPQLFTMSPSREFRSLGQCIEARQLGKNREIGIRTW